MRFVCLGIALGLVSTSFASFDLMLLPSTDGKIYRFDPVNKVHLGSFGSGSQINATAINPTNGQLVAIRDGIATIGYNPHTGETLWGANGGGTANWMGYNSANNRFDILVGSRFLDQIASNTYGYGPPISTTGTLQNYLRYDNGAGLAIGMEYISGTMTYRRWTNGSTPQDQNTVSMASVTMVSNLVEYGSTTQVVLGSGSTFSFMNVNNPTTAFANVSATNMLGGGLTGFDAAGRVYLVKSHTGFYALGKDSASTNWKMFDLLSLGGGNWYNAGGYITNVAYTGALPSIILAPEPGTMAAVGLGLAAILKRRKRVAGSG